MDERLILLLKGINDALTSFSEGMSDGDGHMLMIEWWWSSGDGQMMIVAC